MNNSLCRIILLLFISPIIINGQSIVNTVHNLSVNGPGGIRATSETEVCIFCHTPHGSSPQGPLWNRQDPGQTYTPYNSSTIQASPGQPDGSTILCLSCHDGTIALGSVLSRTESILFNSGISVMPDGSSNLSTDLSDDHPLSFIYDASLAAANSELVDPAVLTGPVKLENERLQCTACHNAHSNIFGHFLTASTQYSDLCSYCHQKTGWDAASHRNSSATWNGSGDNPWFHTPYISVTENACENCHHPHTAEGAERITNYLPEENNCLVCHNGNVTSLNIQSDFNKTYRHDVYLYLGVHDPQEQNTVQNQHVECVDCHNPHTSNSDVASAPDASGKISGVSGVDSDGNPVASIQYEYELCFRCHGDSPVKPGSPTSRQIEQNNVRLEYNLNNPSFHPVAGPGQNSDVPSLLPPYTESSTIYCTDCHSSNNSSANGPHGSSFAQILKYQYITLANTPESYEAYELCFQCHNRISIVNGTGRFARRVHWRHITEENTPCNMCHDPHGINSEQVGASDHSHLINFDISVVSSSSSGRLEFIDNGYFAGECYMTCHGVDHDPRVY